MNQLTSPIQKHIYTDGAAPNNQTGCTQGGIGVAVYTESGTLLDTYKETIRPEAGGTTTNIRCEILALIKGLELSQSTDIVFTDSDYAAKAYNEWLNNWKKKGWKNASKKPVAHSDLWKIIDTIKQSKPEVSVRWVKAHAGIEGNEQADSLASEAASV